MAHVLVHPPPMWKTLMDEEFLVSELGLAQLRAVGGHLGAVSPAGRRSISLVCLLNK